MVATGGVEGAPREGPCLEIRVCLDPCLSVLQGWGRLVSDAEGGSAGDAVWTERHDRHGVPILERSRIVMGEPDSP